MSSAGTERTFTANFTWYMFFSCVVAASGGAVSNPHPFSTSPPETSHYEQMKLRLALHQEDCHALMMSVLLQLFGWDNGVTGENVAAEIAVRAAVHGSLPSEYEATCPTQSRGT